MEVLTRQSNLHIANVKSCYLVSIRLWIFIIRPPPWLFPYNFRQSVYLLLGWPFLERWTLVTENWYKGNTNLSKFSMSWDCNGVYVGVLECWLKSKAFDAWVLPQQAHRSAGFREVVKAAMERTPAPVRGTVCDEPFHRNIISIKTNTAVPSSSKIWEGYLNFRWGSDLFQNISCQINQRRERMTFRLLNDSESDSDMGARKRWIFNWSIFKFGMCRGISRGVGNTSPRSCTASYR